MAHLTKIVQVGLDEIVDGTLEDFLDVLEELWMADYDEEHRGILADISYRAVGFNAQTECIRIAVTAEEDMSLLGDALDRDAC
jgi:hypothetical protein